MAQRLNYTVPPVKDEPTALDALSELLENLHQHGFIRLANDMVKANSEIGKILVAGLNRPGSRNAVQNLSLMMMAVGSIPPERFNHILLALRAAVMATETASEVSENQKAPGLRGIVKLLNDDELWQSLRPLMAVLETFVTEIRREEEPPVTRYSGKPTRE